MFPGQFEDAEAATRYNYFRDYDPATGRYIQSDPIGLAGGLNTYGYVSQTPIMSSDPWGLDETLWRPGPGRSAQAGVRSSIITFNVYVILDVFQKYDNKRPDPLCVYVCMTPYVCKARRQRNGRCQVLAHG